MVWNPDSVNPFTGMPGALTGGGGGGLSCKKDLRAHHCVYGLKSGLGTFQVVQPTGQGGGGRLLYLLGY